MRRFRRNLIVCWLVASTAHFPIPIFDGDDVGNRSSQVETDAAPFDFFDVDFVLLGCDEPDDPDDAPMDVDPEGAEFQRGPFPVFFGPYNTSIARSCNWNAWQTSYLEMHSTNNSAASSSMAALRSVCKVIDRFVEASLGTSTVMRC